MNRRTFSAKYAVTLTLIFMVADKTAHGCQRIVFKKHFSGFV